MVVTPLYKKIVFTFLLLPTLIINTQNNTIVTVIGTGYVGLVTGACLAELGNFVICADIDSRKIKNLNNGVMPIYEQGLHEIITRNTLAGRLSFTDNIDDAIQQGNTIFIAVGTPMDENGRADLSYVNSVVELIAHNINSPKIIVTKSTVPVGTGKKIREQLETTFSIDPKLFSIASNPEFLREGLAVNDFLQPDRIIIGTDSDAALVALCEIYEPLIATGTNYVLTDIQTAEMIKYASNGFLSVKISYINDIANICDKVDADVTVVAYAMGLDHRISPYFLKPGPGFGGSCFPKDSQALAYIAQENGQSCFMIQAALATNQMQQKKPVEKLRQLMKDELNETLQGKVIAILGLAFKANTDDIRYSPAITTIELLQQEGAIVKAYDPVAMPNMHSVFPEITYGKTMYETVEGADAIIIMTEWDEIKQMDLAYIKKITKQSIIIDTRNIINPKILKQAGFLCDTIGQSCLCKNDNNYSHTIVPIHLRKLTP